MTSRESMTPRLTFSKCAVDAEEATSRLKRLAATNWQHLPEQIQREADGEGHDEGDDLLRVSDDAITPMAT